MMRGKKLIEVYEEFTSSRNWIVPAGCKSVDAFVVGGGENGGEANAYISGKGGNGGECKTYTDISVIPGETIPITVGGIRATSYFKNTSYQARGAAGIEGGGSLDFTRREGVEDGRFGYNGVYAFDNPARFPKRFGASGGGGGAVGGNFAEVANGGAGGSYGGGTGGTSQRSSYGTAGSDATWYGAGGGGGGKGHGSIGSGGAGGKGYRGIVILHYWKHE